MGDRGNIVVKSGTEKAWLYSHWGGTDLPVILRDALVRGKGRWDDAPYLARIIFQQMIGKDDGITGYGISASVSDNEHPILVVDCGAQTVQCFGRDDIEIDSGGHAVKLDVYAAFTNEQAMSHGERR